MTERKLNKPYRKHKASYGNRIYTISSASELWQLFAVALGDKRQMECRWAVPPSHRIAS